eukprot:6783193-Prymnesium_polylepis.1
MQPLEYRHVVLELQLEHVVGAPIAVRRRRGEDEPVGPRAIDVGVDEEPHAAATTRVCAAAGGRDSHPQRAKGAGAAAALALVHTADGGICSCVVAGNAHTARPDLVLEIDQPILGSVRWRCDATFRLKGEGHIGRFTHLPLIGLACVAVAIGAQQQPCGRRQ